MEEDVIRTRNDRISRAYDCDKHFPKIAHYQDRYDKQDEIWIRSYYYDNEERVEKLSCEMH